MGGGRPVLCSIPKPDKVTRKQWPCAVFPCISVDMPSSDQEFLLFVLRVDIRSRHPIFCKTIFEGTIKGGDVEQPEGAVDSS